MRPNHEDEAAILVDCVTRLIALADVFPLITINHALERFKSYKTGSRDEDRLVSAAVGLLEGIVKQHGKGQR